MLFSHRRPLCAWRSDQGEISGTVAIAGPPDKPVRRRVRLYDLLSGALLAETWSEALSGAYRFDRLRRRDARYFVLAHDHTGIHNAVVKDALVPVESR